MGKTSPEKLGSGHEWYIASRDFVVIALADIAAALFIYWKLDLKKEARERAALKAQEGLRRTETAHQTLVALRAIVQEVGGAVQALHLHGLRAILILPLGGLDGMVRNPDHWAFDGGTSVFQRARAVLSNVEAWNRDTRRHAHRGQWHEPLNRISASVEALEAEIVRVAAVLPAAPAAQ